MSFIVALVKRYVGDVSIVSATKSYVFVVDDVWSGFGALLIAASRY